MLDKLLNGYKKRSSKETDEVDSELLESYKKRLTDVLYDEELVNEFAPLFAKVHEYDTEGKLVELLETKERQIESIADGSAFQQSNPEEENEVENSAEEEVDHSVEALIQNRGK